jgi:hypothetical protein
VDDDTAGDPMSDRKWIRKTTAELSNALADCGFTAGPRTVARLLRQMDYSLYGNRKSLAEGHHPNRDQQFRYIARVRRLFARAGLPIISVDTKKKELVGLFKNPGRRWRHEARQVKDHDFPSKSLGRAIPYGIYDVEHNDGYVSVGKSHETSAFAGEALRRWWLKVGAKRYAGAKVWLILADCGGANDNRRWLWKQALQKLADEFGVSILVCHDPAGASKWNPIEHRMFSPISNEWAAEPLVSFARVVELINATKTTTGFCCIAELDEGEYPTEKRATKKQKAAICLERRRFLPQLNYFIRPHNYQSKRSSY